MMPASRTRKIIGVIGGVACGKSLVTQMLADIGGTVLDADRIAHEVLNRPEIVEEIVASFNDSSLLDNNDNGSSSRPTINKKRMAQLVFGETKEQRRNRERLEGIIHPRVKTELLSRIEEWKNNSSSTLLVLDIPLLLEREWDKECNEVWFVDTPLERRIQFASQRGWAPDQLAKREVSQLPLEEKRKRADVILDNRGDTKTLRRKVGELVMSPSDDA